MGISRGFSKWTTILCVLSVLFHGLGGLPGAQASWINDKYEEEAEQTFNLIFHKYNHWVRPPQEYVNVTVELDVEHIKSLDLMKRELRTVIRMELMWLDSRLTWSPLIVRHIMADSSSVWTPDLVILNSVLPSQSLLPGILRIRQDGTVSWTKREVVTTSCETDPSGDMHPCYLRLGYMSNLKERQKDRFFDQDKSAVIVKDDLTIHHWELNSMGVDFETDNDTTLPYEMDVEIILKRAGNSVTSGANIQTGNSGNTAYSTEACCSSNGKNGVASRQALLTWSTRGGGAFTLIYVLGLLLASRKLSYGF